MDKINILKFLLMIGSTDSVISDCVTNRNRQVTNHPRVTHTRRITNFSTTIQTSFIRNTKLTQDSNLKRHKIGQDKGKLFIISAIAQIYNALLTSIYVYNNQ